jgi:hypothetical protein
VSWLLTRAPNKSMPRRPWSPRPSSISPRSLLATKSMLVDYAAVSQLERGALNQQAFG